MFFKIPLRLWYTLSETEAKLPVEEEVKKQVSERLRLKLQRKLLRQQRNLVRQQAETVKAAAETSCRQQRPKLRKKEKRNGVLPIFTAVTIIQLFI